MYISCILEFICAIFRLSKFARKYCFIVKIKNVYHCSLIIVVLLTLHLAAAKVCVKGADRYPPGEHMYTQHL